MRAGGVITEGPTEEPLSPPICTSKAVTYRLKQNFQRDHSFVPLSSILGLCLLNVGGKLRQLFSPQDSKLSTNLGFVSCSNAFPLEALHVDVAKLSLPVTNSAPGSQGRLERAAGPAQKQGYGPEVTPKAHAPPLAATLGTGSVAKGISAEDCGRIKQLGMPQKFHVINPEK